MRSRNQLLESLPSSYREHLMSRMEDIVLPFGQTLYRPGHTPRYAHFLTSGVVSIVTFMRDGDSLEVGLIGSEGLVEALHLLGGASGPTTAFVQLEATALRMPFLEFLKEFMSSEPLRAVVGQFIQNESFMLCQIAACNRLHSVDQRLIRLLLMVHDRVGEDTFYLTHEFLAEMIGARRSTISIIAATLQRDKLIEYSRGHLRILDHDRLQKLSCECYSVVRDLVASMNKSDLELSKAS